MEFPRGSILPMVESSPLFEELLSLESGTFRRRLARARAWLLWPGDPWELPEAERTSAYALLRGRLKLVESGEAETAHGGEDGACDSPAPPDDSLAAGDIFGQWTGVCGRPLEEVFSVVEPSVLLECDEEFLEAALGRAASRFKHAFYRALVAPSPLFEGLPEETLEKAIRAARFAHHPPGATIVREGEFGSTMFFILRGRTRVGEREITLDAGQFFGELSAISFQPRTATIRAVTDTLVMECDRLVITDLRKRSPHLKAQIDASYRERAFVAQVSKSPLLRDLGPDALAFIQRTATLESFQPYEPIFLQGEPADALYVVQNGTVNISQETDAGPVAVAQLRSGDVFGEGALLAGASSGQAPTATLNRYLGPVGRRGQTVTALQHVDAVRIPKEAFDEMMSAFPPVAERLQATLRDRQLQNMGRSETSRGRAALRWVMDSQVTPGNHVLAIDMAACIRCGNCVTACEETHDDGISRFSWDGLRGNDDLMPQVRLSSSCQHCEFALCARVCPTNAIERDADFGSVYIDYEKCIRCGRCGNPEQGCPYGSIAIVPASEVERRTTNDERRTTLRERWSFVVRRWSGREIAAAPETAAAPKSGKNYPVKCDLCHGLPFEACVHHCPTGAVFRFDGQQHLEEPLLQLAERARSCPEAPWPLRLRAAFRTPPLAKKPAVLEVSLGDQMEGEPVPFYRPEPGVAELVANLFLTSPGVNVGGGPTRQLRLPLGGGAATAEYQMTAPSPGARSLQLALYQGGFYVGTVPVEAEWG